MSHIVVLGAGVVGVSTAYALARRGHQVTVIERRDGAGLETSFANGGQISASHTDPWPSPANLIKVFQWIGREDAPLKFALTADFRQYAWCLRFLANCTASKSRINTERMLRLALYSRQKLKEITAQHRFYYGRRTTGILHLFRQKRAYDDAVRQADYVGSLGCERRAISVEQCAEIEPALKAVQNTLVGGFFCPDDESGDAHLFTRNLTEICRSMGVTFNFDVSVSALTIAVNQIGSVETTKGPITADAYVVAMGSFSPLLTQTIGMTVPVYPAKGYSVSFPLKDPHNGPVVSLIDDERKLVFSRLGDTLRVAGTAEVAGYDLGIDDRRVRQVLRGALDLFPGCADPSEFEYWTGLRPQTPDSVPIIGRTPYANLFMNTGHGTLGWTMASGSAEVVSDLVSGAEPEIDLDGLEMSRFWTWPNLSWPKPWSLTAGEQP